MTMQIYHNPRCSKSRQTLELLQDKGLDVQIVEYLKTPPSKGELFGILDKLDLEAKSIIRTKEVEFKDMSINLEDKESVIDAIVQVPKLLERPIVVTEDKAAIGRPPENVLKILD